MTLLLPWMSCAHSCRRHTSLQHNTLDSYRQTSGITTVFKASTNIIESRTMMHAVLLSSGIFAVSQVLDRIGHRKV